MSRKHGTWKYSVVVTATLTFFVASIFCCCLGLISPQEAKAAKVPPCHLHKTHENQTTPTQNKDCSYCPHKVQFLAQEKITIGSPTLSILESQQASLNASLQNFLDNFDNTFVFSQGPPGKLASAVPLYLQHSVLRL